MTRCGIGEGHEQLAATFTPELSDHDSEHSRLGVSRHVLVEPQARKGQHVARSPALENPVRGPRAGGDYDRADETVVVEHAEARDSARWKRAQIVMAFDRFTNRRGPDGTNDERSDDGARGSASNLRLRGGGRGVLPVGRPART